LVWDMFCKPKGVRFLEEALNPLIGKSIVFYLKKVEIMELNVSLSEAVKPVDVEKSLNSSSPCKRKTAKFRGLKGGKTDPWDHIESAMGLSVAGFTEEAERAYSWLVSTQLADGSWWSEIKDGVVINSTKETNFAAYIAVGVYHHYLITGNMTFLKAMWPSLSRGIQYAVNMQAPDGEIYWARNRDGVIDKMALLTGCSSIYMSLKCALAVAGVLGIKKPGWQRAKECLGETIRNRPDLFNMIKSRFRWTGIIRSCAGP